MGLLFLSRTLVGETDGLLEGELVGTDVGL